MEEMVAAFLPFFIDLLYICRDNKSIVNKYRLMMMKKRYEVGRIKENEVHLQKKYSSHERRLLNFSYLCGVADNPSQT